jgi:hypothetical protein
LYDLARLHDLSPFLKKKKGKKDCIALLKKSKEEQYKEASLHFSYCTANNCPYSLTTLPGFFV